jgi:hypothetical protein
MLRHVWPLTGAALAAGADLDATSGMPYTRVSA